MWYPFCSYEAIDGSNTPENSWKLILSSKSKSKASVKNMNQETKYYIIFLGNDSTPKNFDVLTKYEIVVELNILQKNIQIFH